MVTWLQFGDLHACEGDDWDSLSTFQRLVAEANEGCSGRIGFAVLPGDNANHSTREQFKRVAEVAAGLASPLFILPGDHDFEAGHLDDFRQYLAAQPLPRKETIGGARILLLDIVSAGSGGPDFRLGQSQSAWLRRRLAEEADAPTLVFMHAFPEDLHEGGEAVATALAEGGVSYVGTGHTHYNDVLNDGHVIYGATRSTGEIEEGPPGFTVSALDGDVVSWRFRALGSGWPFVLITSPSDIRLVTKAQSRTQVPDRSFEVRAEVFGAGPRTRVTATLDGGGGRQLTPDGSGLWCCRFDDVSDGLRVLAVTAVSEDGASNTDTVEVLVRNPRERPKRGPATALGHSLHSVRSWPSHGIPGGRLGPNANGRKW